MGTLPQFILPFSGLGDGVHEFDFQVDASFFAEFEASPIAEGDVKVHVIFDKRPDLMVIQFNLAGTVHAICDRCLEPFSLPIEDDSSLIFKFAEGESDDPDVVHIPKGTKSLHLAKHIYEFIVLAMPMIKTHELAGEECDPEMLKYLEEPVDTEEDDDDAGENPIWGALKDFKTN